MMDATNRYTMMCQKASEIQNLWQPKQCDFIINLEDLEEGLSFCRQGESLVQVVDMYYQDHESSEYQQECQDLSENSLWLPRQDQLQKIIEPDNSKIYAIIAKVIETQYFDFSKNIFVAATDIFYSMEQLWLGYIMKEKYNKMWNEEEWLIVEKE
jgi:hypothetical protein